MACDIGKDTHKSASCGFFWSTPRCCLTISSSICQPNAPTKPKNKTTQRPSRAKALAEAARLATLKYNYFSPVPDKHRCLLQYADKFAFTSGTAGIFGTEQVMNLNSLFDPDNTGTGHQPYGFDQMATFYARYKVNAVSVKMTWNQPAVSGGVVAYLVEPAASLSLTSATISRISELPNVVVRVMPTVEPTTLAFTIQMHTLLGLSKAEYDAQFDDYAAAIGASPAKLTLLRFSFANILDVGGTGCSMLLQMTFDSTFFSRASYAAS